MSEVDQEPQEQDLILPQEDPDYESFIITPAVVGELWESSRPKNMLIELYQKQFKPRRVLEDEPLDYNKLNILAEFQTYNLIFSKNELLLDDIKSAYLLQLFWNLLPLLNNGKLKESTPHHSKSYKEAFDAELLNRYREGLYSKEEIIRISQHSQSFFKHFILYDYVFNNPDIYGTKKNITIIHDEPKIAASLDEALTLVKDQPSKEIDEENEGEERY
mmetsp:Transcript_7612/g.6741  ORF Transcript_7612/g.6741 Transcript_7612/m.6741 type:complete len:218 (+) Transcript_7612:6-659(+)